MKKKYLLIGFIIISSTISAQNVGIGITTPAGKLHVKGSVDVSQLIIDANSTQTNTNPLIKLRKSDGTELMWIHSDHTTNTFVGLTAGRLNTASGGGTFNTFIGSSAGYSNTTGHDNTAIGDGALLFNTTGYENIATGGQALAFNTTGNNNSASGYQALYSNTTGVFNTATGAYSLYFNTTGNSNTASGVNSLYSNTTGNANIAFGNDALYSNTTGSSNIANGYATLYYNTTGTDNIAIGYQALHYNTTGYDNVAYGKNALLYNSTASGNTAIGVSTLVAQSYNNGGVTWLSGNVAIGYQALYSNQPTSTFDGINNTGIGNSALTANTTGAFNTGTGAKALYSNTTGDGNTANGQRALYSNTIASHNTANGYEALYLNTIGNGNTANGSSALYSNINGTYNTATGYVSLALLTTGIGNTAVGYGSLSISGGDGNTALGYLAGPNSTVVSNTTCIGNGATATANNQMVLGNANVTQFYCYGAFVGTTASAPNLTVLNTGQIVRSTSSRRYKKDITPLDINTANIYQLRPVSYNSYTDSSRHFGLIAEEVADIIPELATYSKEKDVIKGSTNDKLIPDAVQYPLLSVLLLKEVQKHEQTINELKAVITEMKILLTTQQKQIEALKK